MKLTIQTLPAGSLVLDASSPGYLLPWYSTLKRLGYAAIMLDVMTTGVQTEAAHALSAGLGIGLFQGYWPEAWTSIQYARQRAEYLIKIAEEIGFPPGLPLWLDLEAVPATVTAEAMEEWVVAWSDEIVKAGYRPGIYEGADNPLGAVNFRHLAAAFQSLVFWRSLSIVTPIEAGYVLMQERGDVTLDGVLVDIDTVRADAKGQTLQVAVSTAAPESAPVPHGGQPGLQQTQNLAKLVVRVQDDLQALRTIMTRTQEAVDQVQAAVTALAHDLDAGRS
jgi:hypothetical protein